QQSYEPDWLVTSADEAAAAVRAAGGRVVTEPFDIPVGRVAVVADPFGNILVLLGCLPPNLERMTTGRSDADVAFLTGSVQSNRSPVFRMFERESVPSEGQR